MGMARRLGGFCREGCQGARAWGGALHQLWSTREPHVASHLRVHLATTERTVLGIYLLGPKPEAWACLPTSLAAHVIQFESGYLHESLVTALNGCASVGNDVGTFLRSLCVSLRLPYESDDSLRSALAALQQVRRQDPTSAAWWSVWESDKADVWSDSCRRVKMSEYLCLTVHIEAVDFIQERITREQCLQEGRALCDLLVDAFRVILAGGRVVMKTQPA